MVEEKHSMIQALTVMRSSAMMSRVAAARQLGEGRKLPLEALHINPCLRLPSAHKYLIGHPPVIQAENPRLALRYPAQSNLRFVAVHLLDVLDLRLPLRDLGRKCFFESLHTNTVTITPKTRQGEDCRRMPGLLLSTCPSCSSYHPL